MTYLLTTTTPRKAIYCLAAFVLAWILCGCAVKAYIVTFYMVDHEEIGADGIFTNLYNSRRLNPSGIKTQEFEIGEWSDDHPLNQKGCDYESILTPAHSAERER